MTNKNYIFCLLTSTIEENKIFDIYDNYISEIIKKYGKFTIINFCRYEHKKKKRNNSKIFKDAYSNKVDFFYPKNKSEFLNYIKNKKVLAIDSLGKTFKEFGIRYLIKRQNIFLILITNIGYLSNEEKTFTNTSKKNKNFLFIKFLNKFIYRLFILLNLFPKTYLYFESRKKIFENFQNGKIRKITKKFPIFDFLLNFINVYKINSTAYDNYINYQKENRNKKGNIVFIDGNYKHQDIAQRENIDLNNLKNKYFKLLKIQFNYLEKIFKKKVEICLHPSSDKNSYKKYFKNFIIYKGKTKEKVLESYMVVFHESSSVMDAIISKKKILIFETDLFGKYFSKRINFYKEILKLPSINIENSTNLTRSKILKKFKSTSKYRNFYVKNNLNSDGTELATKKIIRIIEKLIKNEK